MKKIYILIIAIFIGNIANGQWQQTSGPGCGPINCFAGGGSTTFVGTNEGIYLSTNNGSSWTEVNNGLTSNSIISLAISGNTIFSGSAYDFNSGTSGGIQVSYNNGNSWTAANNGIVANSEIRALAIKDSTVFASTSNGLFISTNLGNSWSFINVDTSYHDNYFPAILIKGNDIFLSRNNGIYKSTNNGNTWALLNTGFTNTIVTSLVIKDTNIFAGTYGEGIFMSSNNGSSWTSMNNGLQSSYGYHIQTLTVSGNSIFAGTHGGVYRSIDNANTWTLVNANLTYDNIALFAIGNNIFAGSGYGVYLSTNNGSSWNLANHGIANSFINALTVNDNKIYACTNKGLFVSNDNGNNWTNLYIMDNLYTIGVADSSIFVQHSYTEIHHPFNTYNILYLSTDNGNSWTAQNFLFDYMYAFVKKGNNYFAATNKGVYQLIKNGNNWTAVNIGLFSVIVNSLTVNGNTIFAGTYSNGIFKTTNNGVSWTPVTIGNSNSVISSFAINNNSIFAATSNSYFTQNSIPIYRSNDNGNNWTAVNNGLPDSTNFKIYSINGKAIFASTNNALYLSSNNGDSWESVSLGLLTNIYINTIALNDSFIFAGTRKYYYNGYGVWKRKLSDILLPDSASVISGLTNVCKSLNTVTYAVTNIPYATSYIWTLPSGEIDTIIANSITISFDSTSSSGYIKAKGLNICGSGVENSKFINVYNSPDIPTIIGLSNPQPFTTSIYSVNEQLGKTYHWTVTNGNILNGLGTNLINIQWGNTGIGQLNIIVSDSSFPYCSSTTTLNINIGNIGIETFEGNNVVNIFPNPAIESINIETNYKTELNYEILNLLGKSITFSSFIEKTNIDISYYPKGIYFIKIISDEQTLIKKFIKE
jgi:hypothetical protein